MQTPLATVENPEILNRQETRTFMDTGSQRKHITKDFTVKNVQFIHSETRSQKNNNIISQIKYQIQKGDDILIKASIAPQIIIPINIPEQENLMKTNYLVDTLAEQVQTSNLGLLISNDHYQELILGERIQAQDVLYLINSILGRILSGRPTCSNSGTPTKNVMFFNMKQTLTLLPQEVQYLSNNSIAETFEPGQEDLWNLDTIGIREPNKQEDLWLLSQALKDSQTGEGCEVTRPWKEENPNVAENIDLSVGQLVSLLKRFEGNQNEGC